jgi:hypothetical protein
MLSLDAYGQHMREEQQASYHSAGAQPETASLNIAVECVFAEHTSALRLLQMAQGTCSDKP